MRKKLNLLLFIQVIPLILAAQLVPGAQTSAETFPSFTSCESLDLSAEDLIDCPEAKLYYYLQDSFLLEKQHEHKGELLIGFTIEETGALSNAVVLESIDTETDAAILKTFAGMPSWIAGTKDGEPVAVEMTLRIKVPIYENTIIDQYREMPRFKGCEHIEDPEERKTCAEREMLMYVYKNIRYPSIARENGVQGTVVIRFIIEKDGEITNAHIIRDIGGGCGQESLRVVKSMSSWIPGKEFNSLVRTQFDLPVKFKLENGGRKKKKRN